MELALNKTQTAGLVVILMMLSLITAISVDMYLPAMPGIVKTFNTSEHLVQLSLVIFMIGGAVGQLFYGPFSDKYGRRPVIMVGLVIYLIATTMCVAATSINMFLFARVLQAFGCCSAIVTAFAIVRDYFVDEQMAKIVAYISAVIIISPVLAPLVGSLFLARYHNWHSIFMGLDIFGFIALLLVVCFLKESNQHIHKNPLGLGKILLGYLEIFKSGKFIGYTLANAMIFGSFLLYISESPFVLMNYFGASEHQYAIDFGIIALGLMAGSLTVSRLVKAFSNRFILLTGASCVITGSVVLLFLAEHYPQLSIMWKFLAPMILISFGVGLVGPCAIACAMQPFDKNAGSASAVMGFTRFLLASCIVAVIDRFFTVTPYILGSVFLLSSCLCLLLVRKVLK